MIALTGSTVDDRMSPPRVARATNMPRCPDRESSDRGLGQVNPSGSVLKYVGRTWLTRPGGDRVMEAGIPTADVMSVPVCLLDQRTLNSRLAPCCPPRRRLHPPRCAGSMSALSGGENGLARHRARPAADGEPALQPPAAPGPTSRPGPSPRILLGRPGSRMHGSAGLARARSDWAGISVPRRPGSRRERTRRREMDRYVTTRGPKWAMRRCYMSRRARW
jgi:hypothetical protein